jgi:hypothetical protein
MVDEQPSGFEASLIRAARREMPSAALRRAAMAAGDLSHATMMASKASATSGALRTLIAAAAKGFLAGAVVAGVVVTSAPLLPSVAPKARYVDHPFAESAEASRAAVSSVAPSDAPPAPPSVEAAASGRRVPVVVPKRNVKGRRETATSSEGDLGAEIRAFELARRDFESGNVAAATAALDRYEHDFVRGALSPEAEVLRIEILAATGKRSAASVRARAFLVAHPSEPAARRVRNWLDHEGIETER